MRWRQRDVLLASSAALCGWLRTQVVVVTSTFFSSSSPWKRRLRCRSSLRRLRCHRRVDSPSAPLWRASHAQCASHPVRCPRRPSRAADRGGAQRVRRAVVAKELNGDLSRLRECSRGRASNTLQRLMPVRDAGVVLPRLLGVGPGVRPSFGRAI